MTTKDRTAITAFSLILGLGLLVFSVDAQTRSFIPPKKTAQKKSAVANKKGEKQKAVKKREAQDDADSEMIKLLKEIKASQKVLQGEMSDLKKELSQSGLIAGTPISLDADQEALKAKLQKELEETQVQLEKLDAAIKSGLDSSLVEASKNEFKQKQVALEEQIAAIVPKGSEASEWHEVKQDVSELKQEVEVNKEALKAAKEESVEDKKEEESKKPGDLSDLLPIDIYAFGDFFFAFRENDLNNFEVGQLELDLEMPLHDTLTVAAAVAYDGESGAFGIGAFTIDGRLVGKEDGHFLKTDKVETLGIMIGQFDVPFGIAYFEYPSIDHRLVTGKLVVDETHDSWNDLGVQLYLDMGWANLVIFGVNGFNYEEDAVDDTGQPVVDDEGNIQLEEVEMTMALGGRLGISPFEFFEFGGSAAGFFDDENNIDMMLAGADLSLDVAGLTVKGEYIYHGIGTAGSDTIKKHGLYAQTMYDFDPVYLIARYSTLFPQDDDTLHQLSGGIGVAVIEYAEIRFEYSTDLNDGGNIVFIQLAGGMGWMPTGFRR